jgi:hypothetical protein
LIWFALAAPSTSVTPTNAVRRRRNFFSMGKKITEVDRGWPGRNL